MTQGGSKHGLCLSLASRPQQVREQQLWASSPPIRPQHAASETFQTQMRLAVTYSAAAEHSTAQHGGLQQHALRVPCVDEFYTVLPKACARCPHESPSKAAIDLCSRHMLLPSAHAALSSDTLPSSPLSRSLLFLRLAPRLAPSPTPRGAATSPPAQPPEPYRPGRTHIKIQMSAGVSAYQAMS